MQPLTPNQINDVLPTLHVAWSAIPGEGLVRVWNISNLTQGVALVAQLADTIASYQSLPTILITHNMVQLALAAADVPGITAREVALAEAIDNLTRDAPNHTT